jgi:prepilin-type N-terminal cleavage/methylation domain-containing protein
MIAFRTAKGFTLVEVLMATSLLGFALIVMFGYHTQAVTANKHARAITDCTYLAQSKMEVLHSLSWTEASGRPSDLADGDGSGGKWDPFYHPSTGSTPTAVSGLGNTTTSFGNPAKYYLSWEVDTMDSISDTWLRVRVRCTYKDNRIDSTRGTTISAYRYRDDVT